MSDIVLRYWDDLTEEQQGYFSQGMRTSNRNLLREYLRVDCERVASYKPDEIFVRFVSQEYEFCDYFIVNAGVFEEMLLRFNLNETASMLSTLREFFLPHCGLVVEEEEVNWKKEGF